MNIFQVSGIIYAALLAPALVYAKLKFLQGIPL
jgi:hypothetical protein